MYHSLRHGTAGQRCRTKGRKRDNGISTNELRDQTFVNKPDFHTEQKNDTLKTHIKT